MKDRKYVAFLDVLGFKELINENPLEVVEGVYKKVIGEGVKKAFDVWKDLPNLNDERSKVHIEIVSDTIILWVDELTTRCFVKLLLTTQHLLFCFLENGFPLRGSLEVGDFKVVNLDLNEYTETSNVKIGRAITNGATNEKAQNWAGCIVTDTAIAEFVKNRTEVDISLQLLIDRFSLVKYDVPVKGRRSILMKLFPFLYSNSTKMSYVLDWTIFCLAFEKKYGEEDIKSFFVSHNKKLNSEAKVKMINTIHFFLDRQKNYNAKR